MESRTTLPDRVRLPLAFDPGRLASALEGFVDEDWTRHYVRQNYEGEWNVVPLRSAAGETHPLRMIFADPGAASFVDTAYMDRAPYLREVLGSFECPLKAARLMRLSPGSSIREHCDPDLDAALGSARLHVPITTSPEVEFLLNRRPVAMAPGSVWYLRLLDPHQVTNRCSGDRVHLVIDAIMNDWLGALLHMGAGEALN